MRPLFKSKKDESPRMFQSDFADFFSRVHFIVSVLIYMPFIVGLCALSRIYFPISIGLSLGLFALGLSLWTLFEYLVHRFLFHWHPKSRWGERVHFIVHGVLHDYPNDSKRLVMPAAVSAPLTMILFGLSCLILGIEFAIPFFVGFELGYLFYDMSHYAVHNLKFNHKYFKTIEKHHMLHHYLDPNFDFGFTSRFWDHVFGTRHEDRERAEHGSGI